VTALAALAPTQPRPRLALVAAILGSSVAFIDGSIVNVALPTIQQDLGGGLAAQQWVVDAYLLTLGSLILVGGSLGDIFGARRVFTLGVGAFGVASVLCAAAPSANTLIVARGVQGVAGALLTPSALAVIASTFDGEHRGAAVGTWTAWTGVAFVIGPLAGGWLLGFASWRWLFLINVPFVLVTVALVLGALPARPREQAHARVDFLGAVLCVAALGGVVFAFIEQPRHGWTSPEIWIPLAGGALLFAAFVLWESRAREPMLKLSLFARRNFSVTNLETLVVYAGLSTLTFFLVLFLQQIVGWSPLESGLSLLPVTIVMFAGSRYVGRWSERIGPRLFMAAGPLVAGAALLPLARLGHGMDYWLEVLPAVLAFSVGLTMTVAPLTSTVLADAGPADAGIASGVNNAVARIAGLLGIAVVGLIVSGRENRLTEHGFHLAMLATAGLLLAGGLIGAAGIRNPRRG
jgi:EmrB/QacA subfamily drug resistance transporter